MTSSRTRRLTITGAVAAGLLAAAVVAGTAVGRGGGTASPAAAPSAASTAPTAAPDPYRLASGICSASEADMERWVGVARTTYPDGERFADFLGTEGAVVDESCPQLRPAFDDATWAAAGIRTGPHGTTP